MHASSPSIVGITGFADPVTASQLVFRSLLAAMAEPGRIERLAMLPSPPPGLSPAAAAVALALADFETSLCVMPASPEVDAYLRFETGARLTARPDEATLAIVARSMVLPELTSFSQGVPEYPDRSTTVIVEVERLEAGRGFSMSGPGIVSTARLLAEPLPADFVPRMAANRALFPLGVDIVLAAADRIACLPRSITIS